MNTGLNTIAEIRLRIEQASQRRLDLWRMLSEGPDPEVRRELRRVEGEIERLWQAQRQIRAEIRFGQREDILKRARTEERIERAAA
jgi:hypothetical protein